MPIQNTGLLSGGSGVDIGSLTEVTPVSGDMLLIEDASDGNIEKKVNASNFLGGVGSIADNAVTNPKLADMESGRFKARITVGTGDPEDLTATQARSLLNVADGSTANPNAIDNVVDDTTPQLGGNLDVNGSKITSVSNGDIDIEPDGTGNVLIGNFTLDADQTVGAGQDNYVLTYDHSTGLISLEVASGAGGGDSNNLGTNTAVNTNSIDDGTSLGQHAFSAYENQDLNVNSNTDTSHYDFSGLSDGDWTLITFINDAASTDYDITFNTGEVAPNSSFTIYAGDRVLCKVIKKGTEIRYNFDVPNLEVA